MPLVPLALLLLAPVVLLALMPVVLALRYRSGTARRAARRWVATLNVWVMSFSALFFLASAAVTTYWIAGTLPSAAAGLVIGCALGVVGIRASRWEATPGSLHYTPNRWLVLAITSAIAVRLLYGAWRTWSAWTEAGAAGSMVDAFGVAGTVGVAGIVLGYYLAYGIGVRRRVRRWERRSLRVA